MIGPVTVPRQRVGNGRMVATDKLDDFWLKSGGSTAEHGCYVFCMTKGKSVVPWYVGVSRSEPWRAHRIRKITEVARSAAIAMLNARAARSECNRRWSTAPNTSHGRKHGTVIAANVMPSSTD